jgi:hypothetical protein
LRCLICNPGKGLTLNRWFFTQGDRKVFIYTEPSYLPIYEGDGCSDLNFEYVMDEGLNFINLI